MKGSDHLDFIVDHRLFRPVSPPEVEDVYEDIAPDAPDFHFVTRSQVEDGTAPDEVMILTPGSHTVLAQTLGVPELSGEVERAIHQVEHQLQRKKTQRSPPAHIESPKKSDEEQKGKS